MKIEVNFPQTQSDILVKDYMEYEKRVDEFKDMNNEEIMNEIIKIFYHLDDRDLLYFNLQDIKRLYENILNILQEEQELVLTFKIGDFKFGFIPNIDDITFGEFVDLDTDDYIRKLCILYRPIIKERKGKYQIAPYSADMSYYEMFKERVPLSVLNGFITFFLDIQKDLVSYILKSLQAEDLTPDQRKILEENGDGFLGYMNSLMEILRRPMK